MRKSMKGIEFMFRKADYPGLPAELQELSYFVQDQGYCIMIIPSSMEEEAWANDPDEYELPIPTKYVLAKGWKIRDGYAIVEVEYDHLVGAKIPDEYYCWGV